MTLKRKKALAREFVFFIAALLITLFAFLYTVYYNAHLNTKIADKRTQIQSNIEKAEELKKPYNAKIQNQRWFFNKVNERFDIDPVHILNYEMLWSNFQRIVEHDSMAIRFNVMWSADIRQGYIDIGFTSAEQLGSFIQRNIITQRDIDNYNEAFSLDSRNQQLVRELDKMSGEFMRSPKQCMFSLNAFLLAMAVLFGLRYLWYGIIWSVKVLRQKGE